MYKVFYNLCKEHLSEELEKVEKMPQGGSERQYFRLFLKNDKTVLGVFNPNVPENEAFIKLQGVFQKQSLPVPVIFGIDKSKQYYLCSDNGKNTLFDLIKKDEAGNLEKSVYEYFEQSIKYLAHFQTSFIKEPNIFEYCNVPKEFDRRSIMWDLNYFKYNFLKVRSVPFNEIALEDDFEKLSSKIASIPMRGFMYRDFQSRNIMIDNGKPVFIDFQGGRHGPLQYDVVSILWQALAELSEQDKESLIKSYIIELQKTLPKSQEYFYRDVDEVILLRLLQVLGAYGFRGLIERRSHFIKSLPSGIKQLVKHWENTDLGKKYPELNSCIYFINKQQEHQQHKIKTTGLTVNICSFSYANGSYPIDLSGHGGGYVFDCRGLQNPGRIDGYKHLTGKDKKVIDYMRLYDEVENFIKAAYQIIERHATLYESQGYLYLFAAFGCTGGQHRSVYCAEEVAKRLEFNGFDVHLWHRDIPKI